MFGSGIRSSCRRIELKFPLIIFILIFSFESIICSKYDYVSCQSVLKLQNTVNGARLHSHEVKYGTGSGQQSVTGVKNADDHNSYWQIMPKFNGKCTRGEPIKCGDVVRFVHVSTKRSLHSHFFLSPLSNNQEVSAFGENGSGDDSDNWIIECNNEFWRRDSEIRVKHQATGKYLHMTGDTFGRPINGQFEVSGIAYSNSKNLWKANEGIFIKPSLSEF